jgi:hypothetical protein
MRIMTNWSATFDGNIVIASLASISFIPNQNLKHYILQAIVSILTLFHISHHAFRSVLLFQQFVYR